eukprot:5783342-Amphidinium_carterae.1
MNDFQAYKASSIAHVFRSGLHAGWTRGEYHAQCSQHVRLRSLAIVDFGEAAQQLSETLGGVSIVACSVSRSCHREESCPGTTQLTREASSSCWLGYFTREEPQ